MLVVGPTGVGQTPLRRRSEQHLRHTFVSAAKEDPERIPVVGVEAAAPDSGNFNWKDYSRRALGALEEPLTDSKRDYRVASVPAPQTGRSAGVRRGDGSALRYALEQALRHRRPAAILIAEAQHLTKIASGRKRADQLDCLKSFASFTGGGHAGRDSTWSGMPGRSTSATRWLRRRSKARRP